MPKMIEVRRIPAALRRALSQRAKLRGETLAQYIQGVLEREVARPLPAEVFARIRSRTAVTTTRPVAEVIDDERRRRSVA